MEHPPRLRVLKSVVQWVQMKHEPNISSAKSTAEESPRKAGRPAVFSEQIVEAICGTIETSGISDAKAALLAGVSRQSFMRWKQKRAAFALRIARARAAFHEACLKEIKAAGSDQAKTDWRAQAWLFEHTPAIAVDEREEGDVDHDETDDRFILTPERLEHLRQRREAALRADREGGNR
jgi:hypothetical protein